MKGEKFMKGKKSIRKVLAILMAVVYTVGGITYTPKQVNASTTEDLESGWTGVGNWNLFSMGSALFRITYDDATNFAGMAITVRSGSTTSSQDPYWTTQCCFLIPGFSPLPGEEYNYTLRVSSSANGSYFIQTPGLTQPISTSLINIAEGEHLEQTGTFTAGKNPASGKGNFLIGLYGMPTGSTLTMEGLTVTDTNGNVVYRSDLEDPTTAEPSTQPETL